MLPTKFWFIWLSSFKGEDFFKNRPIIQKQELHVVAMFAKRSVMVPFLFDIERN
jgi:hypothetical protein